MATAPKVILHGDNQEQTRINEAHGEGTWFVYIRSSSVPVEVRRAGVGCGYWMAIPATEVDEFKKKLERSDCRVEFDSFELRVAGSIFGSESELRDIAERKLLDAASDRRALLVEVGRLAVRNTFGWLRYSLSGRTGIFTRPALDLAGRNEHEVI